MDCPALRWLLLASHDEVENKPWSECDRFTVQSGYSCTELVATATAKVKERDKRSRGHARHRGFHWVRGTVKRMYGGRASNQRQQVMHIFQHF